MVVLLGGLGTPAPSPASPSIPGCLVTTDCNEPCYGAAARDPLNQPCSNPGLAYSLVPRPSRARLDLGDRCTTKELTPRWWLCTFGPLPGLRTIALIGDSHAGHWRATLANLAYALNWRGMSITRSGCPFSRAVPDLPPPLRADCQAWNRRVTRWLLNHPEVNIVFVSEHAGARVSVPPGGSAFAAKVAGYRGAWAALPPSVEHILVIRDTPLNRSTTLPCVEHALARRLRLERVCAVPRRVALIPDPEVVAAGRRRSGRVRVIDLTRLLCDKRLCYPVIGGVLVHIDVDHLTTAFAATLGPFLQRQLRAFMASPRWGVDSIPGAGDLSSPSG